MKFRLVESIIDEDFEVTVDAKVIKIEPPRKTYTRTEAANC